MKLRRRIDWPAALVLLVGLAAIAAAYVSCPAEYRAATLAALGALLGLVQSMTRTIVRRRL